VKKRISGEAYDIKKQTIYRPKSKIESRAYYALEPAQGNCAQQQTNHMP